MKGRPAITESDLSEPVVQWLEQQEYKVNQEVRNCDITAVKGDDLIIMELKKQFSLTLVYQALERKRMTPSVYVVIPLWGSKDMPPQFKRMKMLLQELEIGLLAVRFLRKGPRVELLLHPRDWQKRNRPKQKAALLREISRRYGEFNRGGQSNKTPKITAYRQESLRIAWLLSKVEFSSPAELKKRGACKNCQSHLSQNFYGWFERVSRGQYTLHEAGHKALLEFQSLILELESQWEVNF